jgi:hypothetical protein
MDAAHQRVRALRHGRRVGLRTRLNVVVAPEEETAEEPRLIIEPSGVSTRMRVPIHAPGRGAGGDAVAPPTAPTKVILDQSEVRDAEVGDVANRLEVGGERAARHVMRVRRRRIQYLYVRADLCICLDQIHPVQ